jgi:hypothetical protein
MSKQSRNESVNADVKQTEKEEKFEILNNEPMYFPHMSEVSLVRSSDICKLANEIFKPAYDDYEGSKFEVSQYGEMYLKLYFHHRILDDTDRKVAFSKNSDIINSSNELLGRIKDRSRRSSSGNQYCITKFGKDGLEKFITSPSVRTRDNKVIWNKCYHDIAQPNNAAAAEICTEVSYVSIQEILYLAYGRKMKTGTDINGKELYSPVKFDVKMHQQLFTNGFFKDYQLKIEKICEDVLNETLDDMGIGARTSLGIIK